MAVYQAELPYFDNNGIRGKYMYVAGGCHSIDSGCPSWGTSDPADIRFIGDCFGELEIGYADGTADRIPLILGYTLWLRSIWAESPYPFFGEDRDRLLAEILQRTLSLYGAWELKDTWFLRVKLKGEAVVSVKIITHYPNFGRKITIFFAHMQVYLQKSFSYVRF